MMDWKACAAPALPITKGSFVQVSPLNRGGEGDELFASIAGEGNQELWRYIPFAPPESPDSLVATLDLMVESQGWQTLVIREVGSGQMLGMASYMRVRPEVGSAEVGCVVFSKALQKTAAATEAMFIMARHLFDDLGYRRYEWKCDNDHTASIKAALRLGFSAEGVFRQDRVVKAKNRDTAWFSMIDGEWPRVRSAFEQWLVPSNFDSAGQQLRLLTEIRDRLS